MKVLSIVFKTESCDEYHVTEFVESEQSFINMIVEGWGDQLESVFHWGINGLGDVDIGLADDLFRKALNNAQKEEVF